MSDIIALCAERRGHEKSTTSVDETRVLMQYILPLNEVLVDFNDRLKTLSSGFASFDYEDYGYAYADLTKVFDLLHWIMYFINFCP